MKRHKGLHKLSHHHHHALRLSRLLKKGSPPAKGMPSTIDGKVEYTIRFFNTHILPHFYDEEKIVYPLVKNKSEELDKVIAEAIAEHAKMTFLIHELNISSEKEEVMNELSAAIKNHIRKEERVLLPLLEEQLSEAQFKKLASVLRHIEEFNK